MFSYPLHLSHLSALRVVLGFRLRRASAVLCRLPNSIHSMPASCGSGVGVPRLSSMKIALNGQIFAHFPQPMHFSSSTYMTPFSCTRAFGLQTSTHAGFSHCLHTIGSASSLNMSPLDCSTSFTFKRAFPPCRSAHAISQTPQFSHRFRLTLTTSAIGSHPSGNAFNSR